MITSSLSVQKNNVVENITLKTKNDDVKVKQSKADTSNPSVSLEISDTAKALNFLSLLVKDKGYDTNSFTKIVVTPETRSKIESLLKEFISIITPKWGKPPVGGGLAKIIESSLRPMDIPEKRALVEEIKRKIDALLLSDSTAS